MRPHDCYNSLKKDKFITMNYVVVQSILKALKSLSIQFAS